MFPGLMFSRREAFLRYPLFMALPALIGASLLMSPGQTRGQAAPAPSQTDKQADKDAALVAAVGWHGVRQAEVLIGQGANVNAHTAQGVPMLEVAAGGIFPEDPEFFRILLDKGADVNAMDSQGRTALMVASARGDLAETRALLADGARVNARTRWRWTAVGAAAANGWPALVAFLLDHGARAEDVQAVAPPPAFRNMQNGLITSAQEFLKAGGDINALGASGDTVLIGSVQQGKEAIVRFLVAHGADVNARNSRGETALLCAACTGSVGTARFLLDHGARPNDQDDRGRTALMDAAAMPMAGSALYIPDRDWPGIVRLLLGRGANTGLKDSAGRTALAYAGTDAGDYRRTQIVAALKRTAH